MVLELFQELLLTAVVSVFFTFLVDKISDGHGKGKRFHDTLESSYLPNSCEMLRRQPDEEFQNADGFGTAEQLCGSEGEIAVAEERGRVIGLVLESAGEKAKLADQVGEKVEEISDEIPEQEIIERYNAEDLKKEEEKEEEVKEEKEKEEGEKEEEENVEKEEEKEEEEEDAESSSSDVEIVCVQGTEIGSRRDGVNTEVVGGSLLHSQWEDEWEDIETTELENLFFLAAEYSGSAPGSEALAGLSSDTQLELYGLHKIATKGHCYGFRPLSLRASSLARWYAWKKLGRMAPEIAMALYISLLSKSIPGWELEISEMDAKLKEADDNPQKGILNARHPDSGSSLQNQHSPSVQMKLGDQDFVEVNSVTGGLKVLDQDGLWGNVYRWKQVLLDKWRMQTSKFYSV